jgi:hypothetical protein
VYVQRKLELHEAPTRLEVVRESSDAYSATNLLNAPFKKHEFWQ